VTKPQPEDLKNLADDLGDLNERHAEVLAVEPKIRAALKDVTRLTEKRYHEVTETREPPLPERP
jgi:hypothetical protein